ncbi:hypothetical protein ACSFA7_33335 [Variovorax sp. LT1R20]|uniref:hypothetical protein n=1 Tax=Variovorax sp. LT1R20 TaxID=3443729 RepID=UPI003F484EAF
MEQKDSTRRQWLANAMTVGMGAALTACGGGGGGAGWGGGPLPGNGGGGGSGNGATLDLNTRGELMDALSDKYGEFLAAGGPRKPMESLLEWALQQPHIAEGGVGDRTLWTRFTDGRYFVFNDNWQPVAPTLQGRQAPQQKAGDLAALTTAGPAEVPGNKNAVLLMHSGDDFSPEGVNSVAMAGKALKARGWDVNGDHALTVESLKHRGVVGLLYIGSHGALWGKDEENAFAVLTHTRTSEALDEQYRAELDDGTLVYNRSWSLWHQFRDREKGRPYYAVTGKFFAKYMIFSPHSLVVLMMCNGGAAKSAEFRGDLQRAGAATIVAWDGNSNLKGFDTVDALFDRLTGGQALPPGPDGKPNRAFDFDDVWTYLEKKNLLVNPPAAGDKPADIRRFINGFGIANPVIEQLHVEWKNKLVLHGSFGSVPGTVSVGGTQVPVTLWNPDTIELTLPTGENDPPGSHGDVVVTVLDRTSNVRPLTSWRGEITYLAEQLPTDNGVGILHRTVVLQLHVRGDAYANRAEVDGALKPNTFILFAASDSKARYVAGGSATYPASPTPTVYALRGQSDMEVVGPQDLIGAVDKMCIICRVDAVAGLMEVVPVPDAAMHYDELVDGEVFNRNSVLFEFMGLGFWNANGGLHSHKPLMHGTALPLGASGSVSPYQRTIVTQTFLDGRPHRRQTVTTSGLTATPALRDDVGR